MPVVHPADLWKETGRWYADRLRDWAASWTTPSRDMVLAMTHEEVVADLARKEIQSYRQLPAAGLPHPDQVARRPAPARRPDPRARVHHARQLQPRRRRRRAWTGSTAPTTRPTSTSSSAAACRSSPSASDVGMMGGSMAHEFMYLTPIGEDTLVLCDACGYSANRQVATFRKPPAPPEEPRSRWRRSPRPDVTTIDALAALLSIPPQKTAKAVFMVAALTEARPTEHFVFAVVRGDMDVNETEAGERRAAPRSCAPRARRRSARSAPSPATARPSACTTSLVVVDDAVARLAQPGGRRQRDGLPLAQHELRPRLHRPHMVADIAAAARGRSPARTAARRCARRAGSRSATSSSWARATAPRWAPPSWTRTASRSP